MIIRNAKQLLFINLGQIKPYLNKKNLKIINFFSKKKKKIKITISFLNNFIKNEYYNNILEQYSKILINSNKLIKRNNNFKK